MSSRHRRTLLPRLWLQRLRSAIGPVLGRGVRACLLQARKGGRRPSHEVLGGGVYVRLVLHAAQCPVTLLACVSIASRLRTQPPTVVRRPAVSAVVPWAIVPTSVLGGEVATPPPALWFAVRCGSGLIVIVAVKLIVLTDPLPAGAADRVAPPQRPSPAEVARGSCSARVPVWQRIGPTRGVVNSRPPQRPSPAAAASGNRKVWRRVGNTVPLQRSSPAGVAGGVDSEQRSLELQMSDEGAQSGKSRRRRRRPHFRHRPKAGPQGPAQEPIPPS